MRRGKGGCVCADLRRRVVIKDEGEVAGEEMGVLEPVELL